MNIIKLKFGDVRKKRIVTPNQFMSHMIEHIAWRLGLEIELVWENTNWRSLGIALGKEVIKFPSVRKEGVALGMIDDGSAEIKIDLRGKGMQIRAVTNVDLKWFLSSRCEQIRSGAPLLALLHGLSEGLGARIEVTVCTFEDPHHTWEGVFRGVGIALNKIFVSQSESSKNGRGTRTMVHRKTAETDVRVGVYLGRARKSTISISVDSSINVRGVEKLIRALAKRADFAVDIKFDARVLSSSHVVLEDIGLALGRALLAIFKERMEKIGVNGAGSNVRTSTDFRKSVGVGLSIEGRKFCKVFSGSVAYEDVRKRLLIGQNVLKNLRSEDLDDFLDGFCGGMYCSLLINIRKLEKPEDFWLAVFAGLGDSLRESFLPNPNRKRVIAGVKASLS